MGITSRNYYCLIAGVLAILFAATHAWNGESVVLPALLNDVPIESQITFSYIWHMITAENLLFGVVFIVLFVQNEGRNIRLTAWIFVSCSFV